MTLIERLESADKNSVQATNGSRIFGEAADLLAQQAARIAELEAYNQTRTDEMIAATRRIAELEAYAKHERDLGYEKGYADAEAALRRKIDEAPVVAYVIRNAECDMKGWIPAKVWADGEFQYPLISKEDLQK